MDLEFQQRYEKASALYEEGRYADAEDLISKLLEENDAYADLHNKLGFIHHHKGDLHRAVRHFERALDLNPAYTEASLNLAVTLNDMGEYGRAESVLAKAAQISHPTPTTLDPFISKKIANEHMKLGTIYMDINMVDEAVDEYRKALRLHPDLADIRVRYGVALRTRGEFEAAIPEFLHAKRINPGYGQAWVQLGITYYMKGLVGSAVTELEEALRLNPGLKEARDYLRLLRKEG